MSRWFRIWPLPLVLVMACAGGSQRVLDTTQPPATTVTASPETSSTESPPEPGGDTSGETATTNSPTTTSDRPLAPDFTLQLGEGGSYTLSERDKPVFLVFWAEW